MQQNIYFFARFGVKYGPRFGTRLFINRVAVAHHGLILGQDGATACADLLETYLELYRPTLGNFFVEMLDLWVPRVSGVENHAKRKSEFVWWI